MKSSTRKSSPSTISIEHHWMGLIHIAAATPAIAHSGVRKIVSDLGMIIPWGDFHTKMKYEDLCYTKAKERQLARNYWNQEGFDAAVSKLRGRTGRDHSSVAVQLQGQAKDSRSQGFCMQNLVITVTSDQCFVDVYYRSTEVLQKFMADLIFFSHRLPPLFEELGLTPDFIRFRFANLYLSAVFTPIHLRYDKTPLTFFKTLQEKDPKFFRTCGLSTRRFFNPDHNYTYRTRVKMFEYWKEHVDESKLKSVKSLLDGIQKGSRVELEEDDGDDI